MASKRKTTSRHEHKVRMIGWKDEPPWTMMQEGPEVSTLLTPDGLERHVPNHWFKRMLESVIRRKLLK